MSRGNWNQHRNNLERLRFTANAQYRRGDRSPHWREGRQYLPFWLSMLLAGIVIGIFILLYCWLAPLYLSLL